MRAIVFFCVFAASGAAVYAKRARLDNDPVIAIVRSDMMNELGRLYGNRVSVVVYAASAAEVERTAKKIGRDERVVYFMLDVTKRNADSAVVMATVDYVELGGVFIEYRLDKSGRGWGIRSKKVVGGS